LGTTFSILRSQGTEIDLARTRIGSLIVGAALIDDIIALILLSESLTHSGEAISDLENLGVIDQLGSGSTTSLGWTIGRPLLASAGLALVGPALAFFVARPLFRRYLERRVGLWGRNSQLGIGVFVLSAFLAV
jgi:Kef-type K+ transport system membrane component KefB